VVKLSVPCSGVFRGAWCDAPFGRPWKFFTGVFIWKGALFAIFQQKLQNSTMFGGLLHFQISEKWANLRFPLNSVSASGATPTRGSAPGPRWGLCPQTPVIGSRSARSPWSPLCQILNTPLVPCRHLENKPTNKKRFRFFARLPWSLSNLETWRQRRRS